MLICQKQLRVIVPADKSFFSGGPVQQSARVKREGDPAFACMVVEPIVGDSAHVLPMVASNNTLMGPPMHSAETLSRTVVINEEVRSRVAARRLSCRPARCYETHGVREYAAVAKH